MALILPLIITFVMTALNLGFTHEFILKWMRGYVLGFAVALPSILIIAPKIRKVVEYVTID